MAKTKTAKTTKAATTPAPAKARKKLELIVNAGNTPEAAAPVADEPAKKPRKAKAEKPAKVKKVSALDAAAKVLAGAAEPMNCQEMIDAMAKAKLWSSPNGATPHATLYSAILREINTKGKDARFTKTERGKFAAAK